jgi:pimeloyl-ACP methyl ester carboxylesterase
MNAPRRSAFIAGTLAALVLPRAASAQEADYDLVTATGTIFGTLLLPAAAKRVVLIIPGSGPTDRDGNNPLGVRADSYRRLALALAGLGIASVRYDKRGIAASHAAGPNESDLRFETFIDDAAAWIDKVRADGRFSAFAVAGHSEGSLIGMVAVQRSPVEAYVSIDGAGDPADIVLRRQLGPRLAGTPDLAAANARILDALVRGQTVTDVPPELAPLYRETVQPYLISWFGYDPRAEIQKIRARITIVQGGNDIQVSVEDARSLAAARPDATLVIAATMTHVLSDDNATSLEAQASGVYLDPERPIDPELVRALAGAFGTP